RDDVGDEVVTGFDLPPLDQWGQVLPHGPGGRLGDVVVLGSERDLETPALEELVVLGGDAEDAGDDLDRKAGGDIGHQVRPAPVDHGVDESVDGGGEELVLPADGSGWSE